MGDTSLVDDRTAGVDVPTGPGEAGSHPEAGRYPGGRSRPGGRHCVTRTPGMLFALFDSALRSMGVSDHALT